MVITDHFALKWLYKLQNPSGRQGGLLNCKSMTVVEDRRGSLHNVPDALSRIPEQLVVGSLELDPASFQNRGMFGTEKGTSR